MQHQKNKKKKILNYLKQSKQKSKSSYRSENNSYQPDSGLTQHYITTGAILPEKKTR
jgi:hypothetical protein|tara:strand:- start:571 stop:741 length:171 start_codon:yes stop_codon:yes gene_type:complete